MTITLSSKPCINHYHRILIRAISSVKWLSLPLIALALGCWGAGPQASGYRLLCITATVSVMSSPLVSSTSTIGRLQMTCFSTQFTKLTNSDHFRLLDKAMRPMASLW